MVRNVTVSFAAICRSFAWVFKIDTERPLLEAGLVPEKIRGIHRLACTNDYSMLHMPENVFVE